jgi:hypothetical protein
VTGLECGLAHLGRRVRMESPRVDMVGFMLRYTRNCLNDRLLLARRGAPGPVNFYSDADPLGGHWAANAGN